MVNNHFFIEIYLTAQWCVSKYNPLLLEYATLSVLWVVRIGLTDGTLEETLESTLGTTIQHSLLGFLKMLAMDKK